WDLSWYGRAWRDQNRWLNEVNNQAMNMATRIDRLRPALQRQAGWHGDGSEEYVSAVFGSKNRKQPATQVEAAGLIGHFGRMTNGTLGQFAGDVRNYGLAVVAVIGGIVVNMTSALVAAAAGPVGWIAMAATLAGAIGAYAYYRAAYEDYVT